MKPDVGYIVVGKRYRFLKKPQINNDVRLVLAIINII